MKNQINIGHSKSFFRFVALSSRYFLIDHYGLEVLDQRINCCDGMVEIWRTFVHFIATASAMTSGSRSRRIYHQYRILRIKYALASAIHLSSNPDAHKNAKD